MAITGSYTTDTGVNFNLVANYSYTQNTSTNKSEVTVKLYLRHKSLYASALSGSYLSVAGNKSSYSKTISYSSNTLIDTLLATKTVTVEHGSDGKGSCAIKATFVLNGTYGGKSISTLTLSNTLTLKTIPRSSSLSVASSINTGSSLNVTITPSDTSFKHKIAFIVDNVTKYTSGFIAAGTTSYSYPIPHSWSEDKPSKAMIVRLYTYNSSETLIATIDGNTTINVPTNIVPTITSVTPTLSFGLDGNYVQGKSKVTLTVNAKPGDGSKLVDYYFEGKNISGTDASYTGTSASQTSGIIQSPGNTTYKVRVKDARGRYSEWSSVDIMVQPYGVPIISSINAQRCLSDGTLDNNGTYAYVTIKTTHSSVNDANTVTVTLRNSKDNYATSKQIISSTAGTNTYSGIYSSGFAIDSDYTIEATIIDEYGATDVLSVSLKAAQRSLNIAKYGNGVAIGGMSTVVDRSEAGKFECNWDTEIKARLTASDMYLGEFHIPEMLHGNINITPSAANTPTSKVVTFSKEFSGNPDVVATGHTSVPGTTLLGIGVASHSTTDCTIWLTRTNTTDTTVSWIAMC